MKCIMQKTQHFHEPQGLAPISSIFTFWRKFLGQHKRKKKILALIKPFAVLPTQFAKFGKDIKNMNER